MCIRDRYRTITPFGPPMWQAEVDNVRYMSASPATAVGQKALHRAKRRYRTVKRIQSHIPTKHKYKHKPAFVEIIQKERSCFIAEIRPIKNSTPTAHVSSIWVGYILFGYVAGIWMGSFCGQDRAKFIASVITAFRVLFPVLNGKSTFLCCFPTNVNEIRSDDGPWEDLDTHQILSRLVGKQQN